MKQLIFLLGCLVFHLTLLQFPAFAQFTDDFSDGDFTSNPVWSGDDTVWTVIGGELRSNSSTTNSIFYLSTASSIIQNTQWEFYCNLKLSTSGVRYVDIFLVSDSSNLKGNNSGYFVRIGNTADEVSLYRKDIGSSIIIIDGTDLTINSSSDNPLKVKVTRDSLGSWKLEIDLDTTGFYNVEGISFDSTYKTSNFFGILAKQSTSSSFYKYYFDDFNVGPIPPDTIPPTISSLTVLSDTTLDVQFSEFVDKTTAETDTNYSVNNGIGNPVSALRDSTDSTIVHLTFDTAFGNCITNTLTINNVQDLLGNPIIMPETSDFVYCVPDTAMYRDVVINEIFADPSPQVGLPLIEFVELYNRSSKIFNLNSWTFGDPTTTGILSSLILTPGDHVILCPIADTSSFTTFGNVIGLSSFPTLNNSGDNLTLKEPSSLLIDAVNYDLSWYNDPAKDDGGWSLELINPFNDCSEANNWTASNDPLGGTPGKQNSVFDTLPDTLSPDLVSVFDSTNTIVVL
ncbi:MAG: lamin tail domain-containing protein, partial [Bacteroidetes bacterium]|nr:lamin tail domain-containing protein [Bacteroidota bacterium]